MFTFKRLALASALLMVGAANALPTLQLGILGATYDTSTETGVATVSSFKLYAFLQAGDPTALLTDTYYVSAALTPMLATASTGLGSYKFEGATKNVTADMTYGTPPLDAVYGALYGDLQTHSIFPTYFNEFAFNFTALNRATSVNTQDNASLGGVSFNTNGVGDLYWAEFDVDVSALSSAYAMHFDLYNTDVRNCSRREDCAQVVSREDFAPFSHDAQSLNGGGGGPGGNPNPAPEPATLALVGLALAAMGAAKRRGRKV